MYRLRHALLVAVAAVLVVGPVPASARVVHGGTIDIGRGAAGVELGMGRSEVMLWLGLPTNESGSSLSYSDSAGTLTLQEAADDALVDRIVIASHGRAWRLRDGNAIFTGGGIARLVRRYGSRVRRLRDPTLGRRAYVIAGRYRGRRVRTEFVVDRFTRRARVKRVILEFTSRGPIPAPLQAPGRMVYPQDREAPVSLSPGAPGPFRGGVAQPDGRLVLARRESSGVALVRVQRDGREDPSFGSGGTVHIPVIFAPLADWFSLLVRPDGRLLLAVAAPGVAPGANPSGELIALTADGSSDTSFGAGGRGRSGLAFGCLQCAPASIASDGSIVIAGMTGTPPVVQGGQLVTPPDYHWSVERRHADGTPDLAFGSGGLATVAAGAGSGSGATLLADGSVATTGYAGNRPALAVLRPDGTLDMSFNGGAPVALGGFVDDGPLERRDGTLDVLTHTNDAVHIERVTRAGATTPAVATLPTTEGTLLPLPGGDELLVGAQSSPFEAPVTRISAIELGADGSTANPATARAPFGGGRASRTGSELFVTSQPPVDQTSFGAPAMFTAPEGRLVLAGAVSLAIPAGEDDLVLGEPTILVVDHRLQPDPQFGAATAPKTTLRAAVARTRIDVTWTSTIAITPQIALRLNSSGPGLAAITVTSGRSKIAQQTLAVPRIGRQLVGVALTRNGLRTLRRHATLRVRVTADFRDILGGEATATTHATLRPGTIRCRPCPR